MKNVIMKKKNVKVAWCCSKHDMTSEQSSVLAELCGVTVEEMEIIHLPIVWNSSGHPYDDVRENIKKWKEVYEMCDIVAGVFPPVAMESLAAFRNTEEDYGYSRCVFTPISSVMRITLGGKTIKRFVFHRWMEV